VRQAAESPSKASRVVWANEGYRRTAPSKYDLTSARMCSAGLRFLFCTRADGVGAQNGGIRGDTRQPTAGQRVQAGRSNPAITREHQEHAAEGANDNARAWGSGEMKMSDLLLEFAVAVVAEELGKLFVVVLVLKTTTKEMK
jgi:hypothetical protein